MSNLVAIVGRPNVGKSTLFNRLTQSRRAIVSDTAGTTRDRQYGKCSWNSKEFSIVDTGGWVVNSDDIFEDAIRRQVLVATEEADLVLFLVDVSTGVTDWDEDVAMILRRAKLPVILVANKVDNSSEYYEAAEFYKLGLGEPQCISAATGGGTGDLLDLIIDKLPQENPESVEEEIPRFAVVGRPNAGKSSIINAFIGEDRNIVTEIAGTTRDSIYTRYDKFGFDFYLVDTAGIRRKNKVSEDLEFYSVMRSIRAIENSDVCILMLDATRGVEAQDMNIFQLIQKNKKSLVVVVNKWDLVEDKSQKAINTFEAAIRNRMAPFVDFPIIFASALTKQRIFRVLETLLFSCKKQEKDAAEIVGKTAKIYYDYLLHDNYEAFVDGSFRPDSIPPSYREQLIANAKMFIGQQKEEHQGIKKITISNATIDTLHHTGNAFLLFSYGDKTTEQVIVPMVERKGVWYMR